MLSTNHNNMFKKKIKKVAEPIAENAISKASLVCNLNDCFLKTINHPRKLELATGLLNGEDSESFYVDFGKIRVMEMIKIISDYNADPERYLRSHSLAGCIKCGR